MSSCVLKVISEKQAMKEFAWFCETCRKTLPESIRHKHINKDNKVVCIKCLKKEEGRIPLVIEKMYIEERKKSRKKCGCCKTKLSQSLRHRRLSVGFWVICIKCSKKMLPTDSYSN